MRPRDPHALVVRAELVAGQREARLVPADADPRDAADLEDHRVASTAFSIATISSSTSGLRSLLWPTNRWPSAVAPRSGDDVAAPALRPLRVRRVPELLDRATRRTPAGRRPAPSAQPSSSSISQGSDGSVTARYSAASASCCSARPSRRELASKRPRRSRGSRRGRSRPSGGRRRDADPATRCTGIVGGVMAASAGATLTTAAGGGTGGCPAPGGGAALPGAPASGALPRGAPCGDRERAQAEERSRRTTPARRAPGTSATTRRIAQPARKDTNRLARAGAGAARTAKAPVA